jgi:hypothetical protein
METKICQNCKKNFIIEPDDFGFYEKIKVPPPTFAQSVDFNEDYFLEIIEFFIGVNALYAKNRY